MYVIFEGVDTSGKSTQIELLKQTHSDAIFTKEPGGTELGKQIRQMILRGDTISKTTELFLFLADRSEHFCQTIQANRHKLIISDRGFISGMAYALCNDAIDFDTLIQLNLLALQNTLPQKVVLFWTNETLIKRRMSEKSEDNIEKRGIEYLLQVQDKMLFVIQKLELDYLVIDANYPIQTIQNNIRSYLHDTST